MPDLKYKTIISDYDGTLTVGETVPPETAAAIAEFRRAGGKFVLCSGRSRVSACGRMAANNIECDAIVASQGSVIMAGDKVLLEDGLSCEQLCRISKAIDDEFHREFITTLNGSLFYSGGSKPCMAYVNWAPEQEKIKLEHIYDLAESYPDSKFDKLLVCKHRDENVDAIYDFINKNFQGEVVANSGSSIILEIISAKCTKYDACRIVAEALDIKESETLTIGDSTNDIPLLAFGTGIAVGNAHPELKARAKYVVEDVSARPVELLIRRLLAGECI